MDTDNLISFDVIESQKENIQSLPSGRSARSLAQLFSPTVTTATTITTTSTTTLSPLPTPSATQSIHDATRREYEAELADLADADDPLDVYDRYVRWVLEAYPSVQNTAASGLLPLLERATRAFLPGASASAAAAAPFTGHAQYRNDPRYLRLWLLYIRLFADAPRETFAFLARHGVGDVLALYYEEFAAWLEAAGRWAQADEIYRLGLQKEARPAPRLARKYAEFEARRASNPDANAAAGGETSPALPPVRLALAAKVDPFTLAAAAAAAERDPQAPRANPGLQGSTAATTKSGKPKMTIFADDDAAAEAPALTLAGAGADKARGWERIESLAERKKENVMEPKPWVGETLKAGGRKASTKMAVFKDESIAHRYMLFPNPELAQIVVNPNNGRRERIIANLEAVYPTPEQPGNEMTFAELRAMHRGWVGKSWQSEMPCYHEILRKQEEFAIGTTPERSTRIEPIVDATQKSISAPQETIMLDENGEAKSRKSRRMRIKEVNETQIIKAKLSSPSGRKMTKRKGAREATVTLHTKAATDEIYDLFSQPLDKTEEDVAEESSAEEDDDDDDDNDDYTTDGDYTSGGESTGTGKIAVASEADEDEDNDETENETSDVRSVSEWSDFTTRKHVPRVLDDDAVGEGQDVDDGDVDDTQVSRVGSHAREETQESPFDDVVDEENGRASPPEEAIAVAEDFDLIVLDDPIRASRDGLATPTSPKLPPPPPRTSFVPIPPEDYEAPTRPYRDPLQVSQNRLPFMTPIAEKTESSLGALTIREETGDYFTSKTPSKNGPGQKPPVRMLDDVDSSPFREVVDDARQQPLRKIAAPALIKSRSTATPSVPARGKTAATTAGPIVQDLQCNPVHADTRQMIFDNLSMPLAEYHGFHDHSSQTGGRTQEIKKFTRALAKASKGGGDKTTTSINMPPELLFPKAGRKYTIKRELGAGAFAPVYLVDSEELGDDGVSNAKRRPLEALKMEITDSGVPSPWEFYIMRQAKERLDGHRAAESIVDVYEMHLYRDECFLIEEYRDQGTLLDLVNIARAEAAGSMDEQLVMFFAIELLRTIEALHHQGILHGDLKADNCLVRLPALVDDAVWSARYSRDGAGGWARKGLALIDFGRGIDMRAFRRDVQFYADWPPGPQDCAEIRACRPWTHQIDYHGLAAILHTMLFGKYIDTVEVRVEAPVGLATDANQQLGRDTSSATMLTTTTTMGGSSPSLNTTGASSHGPGMKRQKIRETLKRYWQTDLWARTFDLLLNPSTAAAAATMGTATATTAMGTADGADVSPSPMLAALRAVRLDMETWLEANCERGVGLQASLRRLEGLVGKARR